MAAPTTDDASATSAVTTTSYDACAILPPSAIAAVFPETAGKHFEAHDTTAAVRAAPPLLAHVQERDARGFGATCRYSFPKKDAQAILARTDAKRRALVLERVEARRRLGEDAGALPRLSETLGALEQARVRVVLEMAGRAPFASSAEARVAFEARAHADAGADAQVDGVGDAAIYRRGILHVLSGRHVLRLEVAASEARDLEVARELARLAIPNLPAE